MSGCEFLPWDTEFFGVRIARVCAHALTPESAAPVDHWCQDNDIRAIYFLANSNEPAALQTAAQSGFQLVDIRVTLQLDPARPISSQVPAAAKIRMVRAEDLPALQAIARTAHQDTRFFSDPNFSRERAQDLYAAWIELEAHGRAQQVLVAEDSSAQAVGYISCHFSEPATSGQIGLVGVAAPARGRGIGRSLVLAATNWFIRQGARQVTVVTQGRNVAAQRLYQRCGFVTQDLQLWYHKWYPASK